MRNVENFSAEEENEEPKPEKPLFEEKKEAGAEIKEQEQPEFEKDIGAVEEQEKEIKTEIKNSGYEGVLSKLSQKGRKFAGIALLSLSSFSPSFGAETRNPEKSASRGSAAVKMAESEKSANEQTGESVEETFKYFIKNSNIVEIGDGFFAIDIPIAKEGEPVIIDAEGRPCYKVGPKDLAKMEKIRREHFQKINFALSRRPFSARMVAEGIRDRTERSLKYVIRSCEEIPTNQLPEEIRKPREEEQERIDERKEKIKPVTQEKKEGTEKKLEKEDELPPAIARIDEALKKLKQLKEVENLIKSGQVKEAAKKYVDSLNKNQTK
ncbi:MAG: hypothetical protein AAB361_02905 [Patescibacteria group bacterium]